MLKNKKQINCISALILASFILLSVFCVKKAVAEEVRIADLVVANSSELLLAYFTIENAFTDEMETGLKNGIPIVFSFWIELHKVKKGLPDKKLLSTSFDHTMSFDTLKEEYQIIFSEKKDNKIVSAALTEAKQLMAEVNGLELLPLEALEINSEYVLRTRASMSKRYLPVYFRYLLSWTRFLDFKTEWHSLKFRY